MFSSYNTSGTGGKFEAIKNAFKRLVKLYLESAKLTAVEKLTLLFSAIVVFVAVFTCITISLAFGAVALLQLLELALSPIASAAILAGIFIVLSLLVCLLRKPLVINPTARFLAKLIMDIGNDHIHD